MIAAWWRRWAVCVPICLALAACSTTPSRTESTPGEVGAPGRPKVDTPEESASPSEASGTRPAEDRPGDDRPARTPPRNESDAKEQERAQLKANEPVPSKETESTPPKEKESKPAKDDGSPKESGPTGAPDKGRSDQPAMSEPILPDGAGVPVEENLLEQTRRSVKSSTVWLARGVDSWFGDKPFEEGGRVTDGRLSVSVLKRQDESVDFKVRFNARIRLPNVEERTYLFLGRDNDRETVADTPGALSRQDRLLAEGPDDRTFFAGFGYALREAFDLRVGFHGIKPYAQARYRDTWNLSPRDLIEFRQTFFWRISDRFGSTTAVSYEHAYSSTLALRWLTATTRTQKTRQFDWSSIVGVYKGFAGERLLSLEYVFGGSQHTGYLISEHGTQAKWSQPIYRDWLFIEGIGGLYWPRRALYQSRDRVWAVGSALTMRF